MYVFREAPPSIIIYTKPVHTTFIHMMCHIDVCVICTVVSGGVSSEEREREREILRSVE
jgi:hypothetical protein